MKREQAAKLADQALADLAIALEQGKSETLLKYLDMVAKFYHYSFGNCMLIARQNPNATQVAGFRKWQELGRQVKKGEKGIAILAPLVRRKQEEDEEKSVFGFRAVHVFDVSQTDGDPLPEFAGVLGDVGGNLARLEQIVHGHLIELEYAPLDGGVDGLSTSGKVIVDDRLNQPERFAVLAHELAHELLHKGSRRSDTTKKVRETEAEAVAYVVCQAVGLDTASRSSDYIQLYQGEAETLLVSLEAIRRVSTSILSELEHSAPTDSTTTDSTQSGCNHTLQYQQPGSSWTTEPTPYGPRIVCRYCDRFFAYLPNAYAVGEAESAESVPVATPLPDQGSSVVGLVEEQELPL